jgi:serine/threonine protein kinase
MAPPPPNRFGRYELLRRIGAGGMGEVFLAKEPLASGARAVVIKKILPHLSEDQGFVGRFADEGKVVVHLQDKNIAQVYEMGEVDEQLFMAMEYVEGKTLAKVESRLRERAYSFPIELALYVAAETCAGLGYAHTRADAKGTPLQVVHRDISPSNVMITYDGAVKIIDFGAALSTLKEEMTAPRVVIGNLSYMAPEHARKQKVDHRADLFSVGVMLWELIAWQVIPSDGDPVERWRRAARPNFQKPSHFRPGLPRAIDALVMKALSPDARDRFADASAMRAALLAVMAELAPGVDGTQLGALMGSLFEVESQAERQIVDAALSNDPGALPQGRTLELSDALPLPLDLGGQVTTPDMPALSISGETAERMTDPHGAPLARPDPDHTAPGRPLAVSGEETMAMAGLLSQGRPVERTPTSLPLTRSPYFWVGLGVALGFALMGLLFALYG